MTHLNVRLEVDVAPSDRAAFVSGYTWVGEGQYEGISIKVLPTRGHGFGLTEILDASLVFGGGIAAGVSANLLTDAIKMAIRGTVRRARARRGETELPIPEEDEAFEIEATSLGETFQQALGEAGPESGPDENGRSDPPL